MGLIAIEGMEFYAYHGYYKEEAKLGGLYTVDVYVDANLDEAAESDQLNNTVNYEVIHEISRAAMTHRSKLIEHVCHRIMVGVAEMLTPMGTGRWVKVRVRKEKPPIAGKVRSVYVELEMKIG
jgi:dihydroneopterin aldolase